MPIEPAIKRTIAFFDGQNLFRCAKNTFGYDYPNYDIKALATAICEQQGWELASCRFYTGIPDPVLDPSRNSFWDKKLAAMGRQGIISYRRPLRYRKKSVLLADGTQCTIDSAEEKGIDVQIAVELIRLAHKREYDVALLFSQDQDFSEVAKEIHTIAKEQDRWIKIACAFPRSIACSNRRGVNNTDWIPIDKALYDSCLDKTDYRAKKITP